MGLLRRLRGNNRRAEPAPEAPVEPPARPVQDVDLDSLLALVVETMGHTCTFEGDGTTLLMGDRTVNLVGLRREAARRSREDWPMLVSEHLSHAVSGEPFDACNLQRIRPLLRTRLHAADDPAIPDPSRIIGRHLSADLIEVLTIGGRPVRPEEAFCWPIPPAEALDVAVANALADERITAQWVQLGGVSIRLISAPTAVAHLRGLPCPDDGMLVVLPHPGAVAIHPVEGIGVVKALERMRLYAQREFDERDGNLSPHVYWWHRARLTRIQADFVAQDGQTRLVVTPPAEFAKMLARIAKNG